MSVRAIPGDDVAALMAAAPACEVLADCAIEPNVFLEPWLLLPALRLYGSGKVQVILVERPGANGRNVPIALWPLLPGRCPGLPVRTLRTWMPIHCYYGAPLIARGHCAEALAALWQWLAAQSPTPCVVELPTLAVEGLFFQEFSDFLHRRRMVVYSSELYTRALLCRAETATRYLYESIPGDERRLLRQKHRKLSATGKLEVRLIGRGDDLDAWLERFMLLEASGWKGRMGTALNCSPADREYFVTISREAFVRDRLMLVAMTLDGHLVAAQHGILAGTGAGTGAFALRTVYDEQFRRCSPGMLIDAEVIRLLHEQPHCRWIDSCCAATNSAMKRLWRQRRTITSLVCPVNWRGELLVSLLPMLRYGRRLLRRVAVRSGAARPL